MPIDATGYNELKWALLNLQNAAERQHECEGVLELCEEELEDAKTCLNAAVINTRQAIGEAIGVLEKVSAQERGERGRY